MEMGKSTKRTEMPTGRPDIPTLCFRVLELIALGKIDRTDAQIMSMQLEWPKPSMREIGRRIGVSHPAIIKRVTRLKRLSSI